MGKGKYRQSTIKMHPNHGWRCKPGYKIFVANRGDVRFDIPRTWVIGAPGEQCDIEFRDRKKPDDDCIIQLSVFHHPPGIELTGPSLQEMASSALNHDDPATLWRGPQHYEKRPGAEYVWAEAHYTDRIEKREARSRTCMARGPMSHAIITISYWPEHEKKFLPVWDEILRTLQLGVYIRDPRLGE